MARRRPKMESAFQWIAANDNPGNGDNIEEISGYISTVLIADLWGLDPLEVAHAVHKWRERYLADGTI